MLNILVNDRFYSDLQNGRNITLKHDTMKERVNTAMIVLAREARSINQNELASRINMSPTNLSKIERGDVGVSNELLAAISSVTGYPAHFFLQDGGIVPEHLAFRKRQHVAQKLILPINARANIIRRHVQFLTRALLMERPVLELDVTSQPAALAEALRQRWQLGSAPIENMTSLLEQHGIPSVAFNFGTDRVDSRCIFTDDGYPVVFLNNRLLGDRLRFSLAYELGQLVMHAGRLPALDRDVGHEANSFAAAFLLPAAAIREDMSAGVSVALLAQLKKKWKVSMIALLYRADDLGLITPNQKRYLLQQFNQLQIRRREPIELDIPAERPALVRRWINEYKKKHKLGALEMAAVLCLNIDEFVELYA